MKRTLVALMLCLLLVFTALPAFAAKSTDATLGEVTVNDEKVVIKKTMEVTIPMGAEELELVIEANDKKAELDIECDENCDYDEDDEELTLDADVDKYVINITVTADDDEYEKNYKLVLTRGSSPILKDLAIYDSEEKNATDLMGKTFESDEFEYEIFVKASADTDKVYLELEPEDEDADVYVNDDKLKTKELSSYEVVLTAKKTTIEIEVEYDEYYALYTVEIEREKSTAGNGALTELVVSLDDDEDEALDIYPAFDEDHDTYYVFLTDGEDKVYVYTEADDDDYDVLFDSDSDNQNEEWYEIEIAKNGEKHVITVEDDGDKVGSYTLYFYLGDEDMNNDADLDDIEISYQVSELKWEKAKLDQAVKASTTKYTCTLPGTEYDKIKIAAEAFANDAYVLINGELVESDEYYECSVVKGKNEYKITVIAENCEEVNEYKLTVTYNGLATLPGTAVDGPVLSNLSAKIYNAGDVSLNPTFKSDRLNYTLNVENSAKYVSFKPETMDADGVIYISGYERALNDWTAYLTLAEGLNTFKVTVYEDADKDVSTVYTVTIYRQPADITTKVSSQGVTVDGKEVKLYAYNINGNNFVKLRDVASVLNGSKAQFSVGFSSATNSITLTDGGTYVSNGQENTKLSNPRSVVASSQTIYLDGQKVTPMAYNIDGNNFVMLRDLGLLIDFDVNYNKTTNMIEIVSADPYTAD